jgi:hypothetical protein
MMNRPVRGGGGGGGGGLTQALRWEAARRMAEPACSGRPNECVHKLAGLLVSTLGALENADDWPKSEGRFGHKSVPRLRSLVS